jgi:hypothetical protein
MSTESGDEYCKFLTFVDRIFDNLESHRMCQTIGYPKLGSQHVEEL